MRECGADIKFNNNKYTVDDLRNLPVEEPPVSELWPSKKSVAVKNKNIIPIEENKIDTFNPPDIINFELVEQNTTTSNLDTVNPKQNEENIAETKNVPTDENEEQQDEANPDEANRLKLTPEEKNDEELLKTLRIADNPPGNNDSSDSLKIDENNLGM